MTDAQAIRDYGGDGVRICIHVASGRPVIEAMNQGGHDGTVVDLLDVLAWAKANRPELLAAACQ